jgi:CBS domain-containing protein
MNDFQENGTMGKSQTLRDLMNPYIVTVSDEMTTDELARYLLEREISGAFVVDDQGRLVGVVSMTDIGRNLAEPSDDGSTGSYRDDAAEPTLDDLGQRFVEQRAVTVRDVMTPTIHEVSVTATVSEAARIMVDRHIHRLLVTQGKDPVGILTSTDLLKMVADMR